MHQWLFVQSRHQKGRRIAHALLDDWLGCPAEVLLGGRFSKLPLLRGI